MNAASANNSIDASVIEYADGVGAAWHDAMESGDYRRAAEVVIDGIRETFQRPDTFGDVKPELLFGMRVMLNGLRDLANLKLILSDSSWIDCPKAVETAWSIAHDARARVLDHGGLDADFRRRIAEPVVTVFEAIAKRFGDGIYNSCEFEVDRIVCTICDDDLRGCDHIPGEWYEGKLCQGQLNGGQLIATAFVDNPRDPRCRVWPWQFDESGLVIRHMTAFRIFDLAGDEDGGEVIDLDKLFPKVRSVLRQPSTGIRYDVFAYRKIKRKELIEVVRQVLAERNETPRRNSRVRIVTIVGYDDDY